MLSKRTTKRVKSALTLLSGCDDERIEIIKAYDLLYSLMKGERDMAQSFIDEAYSHGDFDDWYEMTYLPVVGKPFEDLPITAKVEVCKNFNRHLERN